MEDMIKKYLERLRAEYVGSGVAVTHQSAVLREEMVEVSDGKRMKTYICLPDCAIPQGGFPTILQRSCYPMMKDMALAHAEEYAKRGYAFVISFCRGTGGSEGEWLPNENERQDGIDTINWLCGQDWAGDIGYAGSSYLALTGWAMADLLPDRVKTLYLTQYGTDRHVSAYRGGLFRHDVLTSWAMGNAGFKIEADYIESCKYLPHIEVDEKLWGRRLDWYRSWVSSPRREDEYWQQGFWSLLREIPAKVNIPVYIGEGWYDHHLGSALCTYEALPESTKKMSLLNIGCWNHSFQPCMEGREMNNLQNSDMLQMLNWFERVLKRGEIPEGGVRTYQINDDSWREWKSWPLPYNAERTFYLSAGGGLEEQSSEEPGSREYVYDPENPVPSHGAESMLKSMKEVGSLKQPEPNFREDVLSFLSRPVKSDMDITGKINVRLYVSTDAEDTAFTAKVMEVFPDGNAYNIRSSIMTIAHMSAADAPAYTPGDIVPVDIEMWDIDWRVKKDSRIRVDISSSDFPQYAVHTNYAGVWSMQERVKKANQRVHFGGEYPSGVTFPVSE